MGTKKLMRCKCMECGQSWDAVVEAAIPVLNDLEEHGCRACVADRGRIIVDVCELIPPDDLLGRPDDCIRAAALDLTIY